MALLNKGVLRTKGIGLLLAFMQILWPVNHGTDDSMQTLSAMSHGTDVDHGSSRGVMWSFSGPSLMKILESCSSRSIGVSPDICKGFRTSSELLCVTQRTLPHL